jgi:hypothetical protein
MWSAHGLMWTRSVDASDVNGENAEVLIGPSAPSASKSQPPPRPSHWHHLHLHPPPQLSDHVAPTSIPTIYTPSRGGFDVYPVPSKASATTHVDTTSHLDLAVHARRGGHTSEWIEAGILSGQWINRGGPPKLKRICLEHSGIEESFLDVGDNSFYESDHFVRVCSTRSPTPG